MNITQAQDLLKSLSPEKGQADEIRARVLSRNDYYSLNPELAPRSHTDALALVGIVEDLRKQTEEQAREIEMLRRDIRRLTAWA